MNKFFTKFKKIFSRDKEHEHFSHKLMHNFMLFLFLLIIVVQIGFLVNIFVNFDKSKFLASVLPGVLTMLTNEQRAQNNVSVLIKNDLLEKAAKLKAEDMAFRGYFSHNSPDGKTPWYWLEQVGYDYKYAGENLAVNFFESKDVADAWMNSPSHRANIVKKEYTEIGIATASGIYQGQNSVFVVQFFGTPKIVTPLTNTTITKEPSKMVSSPTKPTPKPAATPKSTPTKTEPKVVATPPVEETQEKERVLSSETDTTVTSSGILATVKDTKEYSNVKLFINKILTSPKNFIDNLYTGILLFVVALLFLVLVLSERKHPVILARGLGLVSVILFLLFVNIQISNTKEVSIPSEELTANIIAS